MIAPPDEELLSTYLRINELKNYAYCPRISFYTLCLGIDRETGLSKMGIEAEAEVKTRMKRRKHALHAVVDGQRHFDVTVFSHTYRIVGRLDEVVEAADGIYLIDYKDTDRDYFLSGEQAMEYGLIDKVVFDKRIFSKDDDKKSD